VYSSPALRQSESEDDNDRTLPPIKDLECLPRPQHEPEPARTFNAPPLPRPVAETALVKEYWGSSIPSSNSNLLSGFGASDGPPQIAQSAAQEDSGNSSRGWLGQVETVSNAPSVAKKFGLFGGWGGGRTASAEEEQPFIPSPEPEPAAVPALPPPPRSPSPPPAPEPAPAPVQAEPEAPVDDWFAPAPPPAPWPEPEEPMPVAVPADDWFAPAAKTKAGGKKKGKK
jgi:hypothetical protein